MTVLERKHPLQSYFGSKLAADAITMSADLALVVDVAGSILEVATGDGFEASAGWRKLVGQRWRDSVTIESQTKVDLMLKEVRNGGPTRAREINQNAEGVGEVPFRFNALALDAQQRVVVLGRDLRPISKVQQSMVLAQQAMEREYGRLRQLDTRYRVLFHVAAEGVLIADATTRRLVEANPAAAATFGESSRSLQGKSILDLFEPSSRAVVDAELVSVQAGARPNDVQVFLLGRKEQAVTVALSLFRQAGTAHVLLRLRETSGAASATGPRTSRMMSVVEKMPDGFVVTGEDRRILFANSAFCELVQQANEKQVMGEPLDRWLGRPGVDLNIMVANLREHGTVQNFATIVRSDFGTSQEAIVTAVSALDGKVPCLGFTVRSASSRLPSVALTGAAAAMPRSVEQLRELVGRVSLKELVRESADLVERLCIEAALDVSGNNRASAAQLLGLSRQGLYSKLRRYGLSEFDPT